MAADHHWILAIAGLIKHCNLSWIAMASMASTMSIPQLKDSQLPFSPTSFWNMCKFLSLIRIFIFFHKQTLDFFSLSNVPRKNDQTENEIVNSNSFKAPTKLPFNISKAIERDIQIASENIDKWVLKMYISRIYSEFCGDVVSCDDRIN